MKMSLSARLKRKHKEQMHSGAKRGEVFTLNAANGTGKSSLPRVGVSEMPKTKPIHDWDFDQLTEEETDVMNYVAFSGYAGGVVPDAKNTVRLVTLELIKVVKGTDGKLEYWMDLYVHMLWCHHVGEEGAEDPRR
jgi:hypothetical protein